MALALAAVLLFSGPSMAAGGAALSNGITDFSGRSYDTLVIATASGNDIAGHTYESSAPGSKRLVEGLSTTGNFYDTFDIGDQVQAKQIMRRNWAGIKPSVNFYDILMK
jgi:hypothetical protein